MTVVDACLFAGEQDMLTLRFLTLQDVVDEFVVVACTRTHQAQPLDDEELDRIAYGFARARERADVLATFRWFDPSMKVWMHNREWTRKESERGPAGDGWFMHIERQHRNYVADAVRQTVQDPDAIVMVSDVDEIPKPSVVPELPTQWLLPHVPRICLGMRFHTWGLDLLSPQQPWSGTTVSRLSWLHPQVDRDARTTIGTREQSIALVGNAGWHFSWFGTMDDKYRKLESFSHAELLGTDLWKCRYEGTDTNGMPLRRLTPEDIVQMDWPAPMVNGSWPVPDSWWSSDLTSMTIRQ